MKERKLNEMAPAERQDLLGLVYQELLSPQFNPEEYAPQEEADPTNEEALGKLPEGVKKLFAYAQRLFIWCLNPPEDTPRDVLPVLSLKLEAARYLLVEEIMVRFGERLNGRQFELRRDWTVVATDNLRDGGCENICGACMSQVRVLEPMEQGDRRVCVPVLATAGIAIGDSPLMN